MDMELFQTVNSTLLDNNLSDILQKINCMIEKNVQRINLENVELIDIELYKEIESIIELSNTKIYFGKTLRDLKCVILDDDSVREHEIFFHYKGPKKLTVSSVKLPYSSLLDREYKSIGEIIEVFRKYISDLTCYFYELERLDRFCSVMEPLNPSFKDDYRRILLDDRTWLHIEVTLDGLATNIHLVGQSEEWQDKLQAGLLSWDHDKDIVENIMTVFDISNFAQPTSKPATSIEVGAFGDPVGDVQLCSICLSSELPDTTGVPQPLCQNSMCGVHFHRLCLYEWLVACSGNRPPAFGVATGTCPTCFHPISCSDRDK